MSPESLITLSSLFTQCAPALTRVDKETKKPLRYSRGFRVEERLQAVELYEALSL
jgi:hypothetical protein